MLQFHHQKCCKMQRILWELVMLFNVKTNGPQSLIQSTLKSSNGAVLCCWWVLCTVCYVTRYVGYRHPPWSANKYEYTTEFWHVIASRFIFIVCFEVSRFWTLVHVVVQQYMMAVVCVIWMVELISVVLWSCWFSDKNGWKSGFSYPQEFWCRDQVPLSDNSRARIYWLVYMY